MIDFFGPDNKDLVVKINIKIINPIRAYPKNLMAEIFDGFAESMFFSTTLFPTNSS